MTYRLLALDVDGTLVGPDGIVSDDVVDAVGQADAAGLRVVLATGRSYVETVGIWRQLRLRAPYGPMVLVSGALVSEPDTARTLYQQTIPWDLACRYAEVLGEAGYSAMAIVDAWRHGWDYILCEADDAGAVQRDWFDKMDVKVKRVDHLAEATDLPDPLRINAVVAPADAEALAAEMTRRFDGQLNVHAIVAPHYDVTVLEAFSSRTSKWNALKYVAQGWRIGLRAIVAVGDDVNDLTMVRRAGLGVAMPNGARAVIDQADCVAENGLAEFIRRLLAGRSQAGENR